MTLIKMTRTISGAADGITVKQYVEGETYDVPESLANTFVNDDKAAERVNAPVEQPSEPETLKAEKPLKNKADKATENKGA